jgi:hypothetical protein
MQFTQPTSFKGGFPMTELAHRSSDGIEVALLWSPTTNRLFVAVQDGRTGDQFTVDAPKDRALDVFNHPFAYALPTAA